MIARVYPSERTLTEAAAQLLVSRAEKAVHRNGRLVLALSGGSTPIPLYRKLARPPAGHALDWQRTHLFWADERCVPVEDDRSNRKLVEDILLDTVPLPPDQIHPVDTTRPPPQAAAAYHRTLEQFFAGSPPVFDVILLGMGRDGHTASLFPGAPALDETEAMAVAARPPGDGLPRVTLTLPVLNAARLVVFLVSGREKADAVGEVLGRENRDLPAARVHPEQGELVWLLDAEAASRISG
jgi:6-phosphogluconolactonase